MYKVLSKKTRHTVKEILRFKQPALEIIVMIRSLLLFSIEQT
jgi:hypothetical protein